MAIVAASVEALTWILKNYIFSLIRIANIAFCAKTFSPFHCWICRPGKFWLIGLSVLVCLWIQTWVLRRHNRRCWWKSWWHLCVRPLKDQFWQGGLEQRRSEVIHICLRNQEFAKTHKVCVWLFQVMSARDKKLQTDDCTKLTHHLLIMLPKLLSKVI